MKPVLLLIPGMLNDARVWEAVVAALDGAADVRALPLLAQESVPAMARAAWEQVAAVPPAVPLLLAGFSLGGYVALEMLAHPVRQVAGAALVSTSARPESPEGRASRARTIEAMEADFPKVVDGIIKWGTHAATPEVVQRLRAMMLEVGAPAAIRQSRAVMERADHRAALERLALPVAVLCGRQDRITPPALSGELATLLPSARLELVDGAGHMLPAEQPGAVAAALRSLLEQAGRAMTMNHNRGDK